MQKQEKNKMSKKNDYNQLPHVSPTVGQEVSCVMNGVKQEYLKDNQKLRDFLRKVLIGRNFNILDESFKEFSPQGVTIYFLLSESHASIHTYPEHDCLHLSIYSCRGPKDAEPIFDAIKKELKPKKIIYEVINQVPLI